MKREIVGIILEPEPNYDEFAFRYFILNLNKIQDFYEFVFPEVPAKSKYCYEDTYDDTNKLFNFYGQTVKPKIEFENEPVYFFNIIKSTIGENYFSVSRGNVAFITTDYWEKYFAPPSLFEYLIHAIINQLLCMNKKLGVRFHHDTKGCYLDYAYLKMDARVDIALGYVCDECREKIESGMGDKYLNDIKKVMSKEWTGNKDDFGSVAHNLKKFFKFDIDKDSGFNKTYWDQAKDQFHEIPKDVILIVFSIIFGIVIGKVL